MDDETTTLEEGEITSTVGSSFFAEAADDTDGDDTDTTDGDSADGDADDSDADDSDSDDTDAG